MATKPSPATAKSSPSRRRFSEEFRRDAVPMLLDGHAATDVADRLGLSGPNLLYRWKARHLRQSGPFATALDDRVRQLETDLLRVTRERDILKMLGGQSSLSPAQTRLKPRRPRTWPGRTGTSGVGCGPSWRSGGSVGPTAGGSAGTRTDT